MTFPSSLSLSLCSLTSPSPTGEFSLHTLMASEYDLKEASKKFRFVMHPKVQSELQPLQVAEFMANDEQR